MKCAICQERDTLFAVCTVCAKPLAVARLAPEQIHSHAVKSAGAALADQWGRPHSLAADTLIGRHIEGLGIAILHGSVSRHHARLTLDRQSGTWTVRDLGSSNGTTLNGAPISGANPLRHRDILVAGGVAGFVFLDPFVDIPDVGETVIGETFRPDDGIASPVLQDATLPRLFVDDDESEDITTTLRTSDLKLSEPTGGGGGLLEVGGKQVQLSPTQFEFLNLLASRMRDERRQPEMVRGFVRTAELLADLSWDTPHPMENHVKQLVRRVRRAMIKAEIGDLIESRHRFGYRLRVIPRDIES